MRYIRIPIDLIRWAEITEQVGDEVWRATLNSRDVVLEIVEDRIPGPIWHEISEST